MTSEEIKQSISMREIVEQYGIRIDRKGFCCCPFHNEKTASMKIYKDSFYCFGCHSSGDVFTFVQKMDNCDFKTAFISLGGIYADMSTNARIAANTQRERQKNKKEREEKEQARFKQELIYYIDLCREGIRSLEPFSDVWCICQDNLPILIDAWETKFERDEEIDEVNVYRICRKIKSAIYP